MQDMKEKTKCKAYSQKLEAILYIKDSDFKN